EPKNELDSLKHRKRVLRNISNPTISPIAIPLKPLNPFVRTTAYITAINNNDAKTSTPKMKERRKALRLTVYIF
ncbi:MAG: hypothetical protein QOA70_05805, partial [Nitrososphaeraceae archaeon]|nr:hypothetical protein [Nitrososphaeraceae archaeon]